MARDDRSQGKDASSAPGRSVSSSRRTRDSRDVRGEVRRHVGSDTEDEERSEADEAAGRAEHTNRPERPVRSRSFHHADRPHRDEREGRRSDRNAGSKPGLLERLHLVERVTPTDDEAEPEDYGDRSRTERPSHLRRTASGRADLKGADEPRGARPVTRDLDEPAWRDTTHLPWTSAARRTVKHCLDESGDRVKPVAKSSQHTGWRFIFNPVYCFFAFCISVVALTVLGVVMVSSSSSVENVAQGSSPWLGAWNQLKFAGLGLILAAVMAIPGKKWHHFVTYGLCIVALIAQVLTLLFGVEVNGNKGWLAIGGFQFQPSELLKLAMCVILPVLLLNAYKSSERRWYIRWLCPLVAAVMGIALVLLTHDMGTSVILFIICFGAIFLAGFSGRLTLIGLAAACVVAAIAVSLNPTRQSRILVTIRGCSAEDAQGNCYQVIHGLYALSSGGLTGLGVGNSREKWNYLPEAESDFIFAIIGEEWGFVGAGFVIILFALMAWSLIIMALNQSTFTGRMTLLCVFLWFIPQALINIVIVLGVFPVMGLPLPFVSAGGSSLVSCLGASGLVINIARRQKEIRAVTAVG